MDEQVAFFQIGDEHHNVSRAAMPAERPKREIKPAARVTPKKPSEPKQKPVVQLKQTATSGSNGGPVKKMQAELATAVNEDKDWKEF